MGYSVLINYRSNESAAKETLTLIQEAGGSAELLPFDVADSQAIETTLDSWKAAHPDAIIEVLVNNAGFRKDALFIWMEEEDWRSIMDTHLDAFFFVTRRVIKEMIVNKYGRIINIVSLSGIKGMPGQTNYSAAKAGVIGGTKALAQEVGRRRVTVNAVAPGFIRTEMIEDIDEKNYKKIIPVARFGTPEEVAEAVGFLASEKASYITGEVLSVNGGLYT
jgi:3-oxoacyl-[acyl-carrier protein] reductase